MHKITRDKLQNLVGKLYVESGNEFGYNSCDVVNNMMLLHSYIISNMTTHIRRTRRAINIVEVVCIVLILLSLIIESVPYKILEDLDNASGGADTDISALEEKVKTLETKVKALEDASV